MVPIFYFKTFKGSTDFLEAIGWCETEIDGEIFFVHMGTHQQIKDALSALNEPAEVPRPTLYRNPKHLTPAEGRFNSPCFFILNFLGNQRVNLPSDFFKLTTNEVNSIQEEKELNRKQTEILMTSAMRENAALQEKRSYKYSIVRIRLPDSSFLEVCKLLSILSELTINYNVILGYIQCLRKGQ